MRNQSKKKKILVSVTVILLVAAMGAGIFYGVSHSKKDPIPVIEFSNIGMTEYWGDNMESYGPVSSDNIQTVFLSDTQKVTEVLVKEGDTVKKGDPMMTFDTTLSGLDLERKRLEVEKLKLEFQQAEQEMKKILAMKPMETPPPIEEEDLSPNLGQELTKPFRISGKPGFDGSSAEAPLIVWLREDTEIDQYLIDEILETALNIRLGNVELPKSSPSPEEGAEVPDPVPEEEVPDPIPPVETEEPQPPQTEEPAPQESQEPETEAPPTEEPQEPEDTRVTITFDCDPKDVQIDLRRYDASTPVERVGTNRYKAEPGVYYYTVRKDGYETLADQRLDVSADTVVKLSLKKDPDKLNSCFAVFKMTEGNMSKGARTLWQGVKLYQRGGFRFFDAVMIPDYTMAVSLDEDMNMPEFDMGSGMTAAQIGELRAEQEKKIDELELKVKMAEAEYKIKKRELEDGNIYAEFDGKVVSLLSEEESRKMKKPMIKVSGGGGYQVEGSVNELDREKMKIGQEVTVNDWNTGGSYTGKIIAIGEFPIRRGGYNGRGNPNSSYYPFTAFVDGEADLQTGSYVSIQYASGDSENGLYLSNPFVREEKGKSYVYVMNDQERLEKRTVTTGKSLWGSYTEITSGLTQEDYLAFPYGKNVKPGAKAKIGDMSDFYN